MSRDLSAVVAATGLDKALAQLEAAEQRIEQLLPPCPLDYAILKLLVHKRRTAHCLTYWLSECGRETNVYEVRGTLGRLQGCGRTLVYVPPLGSVNVEEEFALSNAGFDALVAYLRATSNTEVRR